MRDQREVVTGWTVTGRRGMSITQTVNNASLICVEVGAGGRCNPSYLSPTPHAAFHASRTKIHNAGYGGAATSTRLLNPHHTWPHARICCNFSIFARRGGRVKSLAGHPRNRTGSAAQGIPSFEFLEASRYWAAACPRGCFGTVDSIEYKCHVHCTFFVRKSGVKAPTIVETGHHFLCELVQDQRIDTRIPSERHGAVKVLCFAIEPKLYLRFPCVVRRHRKRVSVLLALRAFPFQLSL